MSSVFLQNVNRTHYKRNCLLKYITLPFHSPPLYHRHQNMWQVPEIARIIGHYDYNVDVINYDDQQTKLGKKYELLIDIYPQNNKVYQNNLASNCIKVLYSTGAGPDWQNTQQRARVSALNARRHARLRPKSIVQPFGPEIASFDAMFLIGNEFTRSTYDNLPINKIYMIKNSAYLFPACELNKKTPNTFLYMATYPQALKGLDLLLEVFGRNQNISLVIAGQYEAEKDFCAIYSRELYQCPNILPVGVIDVTSNLFEKIRQIASFFVLPSCSEGMSGSVLTAMSAGLIPIVSRACGFSDDEVFHFQDCSINCIKDTLTAFAKKPLNWVKKESLQAVETVHSRYTPNHFSQSFYTALQGLLGG
ncbi:MAG: glycosyltransferase [Veillonellaceae bacterium]|jgi:glycosyltransferase involved in cell wall biosynthesis|nr:glycosyltransferase [Veillonellaceae bacterium]